jgi:hypothetical protein
MHTLACDEIRLPPAPRPSLNVSIRHAASQEVSRFKTATVKLAEKHLARNVNNR